MAFWFTYAELQRHCSRGWVPLAVLGRARRYPLARVARLSGLAGVAHVLVSLLLGVAGRGHGHAPDHHHHRLPDHGGVRGSHGHGGGRLRGLSAIVVPFGAAASPDLTILPVFLAATAVGAGTAVGSLVAFAAVTVSTIVALTLLATLGGYHVRGRWPGRWGNTITAATLCGSSAAPDANPPTVAGGDRAFLLICHRRGKVPLGARGTIRDDVAP